MISWETSEPVYRLALDWSIAADGSPICFDDGAAYDSIESTITGRLLPSEMESLLTAWNGPRTYNMTSTGWLLGPEIDMSSGVTVMLIDLVNDGPVDSAMGAYDVTITVSYGPISIPSSGDVEVALLSGVPYASAIPMSTSALMENGSTSVSDFDTAVQRSCKWYASYLPNDAAALVARGLRYLRGGVYNWTPPAGLEPWGPGLSASGDIMITGWAIVADSAMTWGVEMMLVKMTAIEDIDYMVGDTDENMVGDDDADMVGA